MEKLDRKVQMLLDHNIDPMNILKGFNALRRADDVCVSRLQQFEATNCKISIWDISGDDKRFQKVLAKSYTKCDNLDYVESINDEKSRVESAIMEAFDCNSEEAAKIYYAQSNSLIGVESLRANIQLLIEHGVDREAIKTYFNIVFFPLDVLQRRLQLLHQMKATNVGDFLPLLTVDDRKLKTFIKKLDDNRSGGIHSIYYFSEQLNVSSLSEMEALNTFCLKTLNKKIFIPDAGVECMYTIR